MLKCQLPRARRCKYTCTDVLYTFAPKSLSSTERGKGPINKRTMHPVLIFSISPLVFALQTRKSFLRNFTPPMDRVFKNGRDRRFSLPKRFWECLRDLYYYYVMCACVYDMYAATTFKRFSESSLWHDKEIFNKPPKIRDNGVYANAL